MGDRASEPNRAAAQALRQDLRDADDGKIRRITAMLDDVADTTAKQVIMEPLRDRLGSMKPVRPLRFVRLLFTPLDPLIVPANAWRPGDAAVPRSVAASLAGVVRAGLGDQTGVIDALIAGHHTDAIQVITAAGEALWPRAGEILAASRVPADWEETGLRPSFYPPLAGSVAAVLRRAPRLRSLSRDAAVGMLEADPRRIEDIVRDIADAPPEGCAMVAELILLQAPHAAPLLLQCISSTRDMEAKVALQQATARGMEQVLARMESQSGIIAEIARGPLPGVGEHVRRIATFLREMGDDTGAPVQRSRLQAIRESLDQTCRVRFAKGLAEGLVAPLMAGSGEVDGAGQSEIEACARDLRTLEAVARKVGGSAHYDQLLTQASQTVRLAAASGLLTSVRQFRLIEILSGSEAAAALYRADREHG